MNRMEHAEKLLSLVEEGTSPFHVAASVERQLKKAGFQRLAMGQDWSLENGGRYYLVHNGSSLAAFTIGKRFAFGDTFRIAAAHTDFPGLRVKPSPEMEKDGYRQLNVEVYGGAILNTWLDRPLSAAGRVTLRSGDIFHPEIRYVDFEKPFLTIPNLAIHINKEVNKGVELNRQKELLPVLGLGPSGEEEKDGDFFLEYLARKLRVEKEDILDYELGLYNADAGDFLGMSEEFISSPRLDNLTSVQEAVGGRFELGVANVPMVNEDATGGVNLSGGALFTFHKDAQKEKAVWTFMKYLTSAQAQLEWHIATGYLPVNKDTYTMQEYIDHTLANPLFKVASDQLLASNAKVTGLWIPNAYQVYYSFQAGIRSMLEEGRDVDETVSALADEIDGYLDEYHSINGD